VICQRYRVLANYVHLARVALVQNILLGCLIRKTYRVQKSDCQHGPNPRPRLHQHAHTNPYAKNVSYILHKHVTVPPSPTYMQQNRTLILDLLVLHATITSEFERCTSVFHCTSLIVLSFAGTVTVLPAPGKVSRSLIASQRDSPQQVETSNKDLQHDNMLAESLLAWCRCAPCKSCDELCDAI
jgi:hypothetical protein